MGNPEVLILDEPTKGLDPEWRLKFKRFLKDYARKNSASVLFSTHILGDVDEVCERVTIIRNGRALFSGSLDEFRRSVPARGVLVNVREVEKALAALEKAGYAPKLLKGYILVENAEPSDVNGLLVGNGITVEEIKRNEPSLEEVYSMLYGS